MSNRKIGKLIIQIPCFNEEAALPVTLAELPREVPGFARVEWMVIDDGSADRTVDVARAHGVDHIVQLRGHQGLARGFMAGLEASVEAGADVIVNTDADNQYFAGDIPALVAPILEGRADMVIGARPISDIAHFSPLKKTLQRLGSAVIRLASKTQVDDAPSGFRAISRETAIRLNVFSEYTYTLETIIQAGQKGMAVVSVPVRVNGELRPSRLMKSMSAYIRRSLVTMLRIFVTYRPFRFFMAVAAAAFSLGLLLGLRYLYFIAIGEGTGHIQSVILAALLLGSGVAFSVVGTLADLISVNRNLLEQIKWKLAKVEERIRRLEDRT